VLLTACHPAGHLQCYRTLTVSHRRVCHHICLLHVWTSFKTTCDVVTLLAHNTWWLLLM
jgi:hypothetical protein